MAFGLAQNIERRNPHMSFIVPSRLLSLACLGLACIAGAAQAGAQAFELSCQTKISERQLLRQAPSGARRSAEHVLELSFQHGSRQFVDKPPYDELGGLRWRYCAFDRRTNTHLIEKADEGLFSGILLFQDTGKALAAGHTVIFSQDRQAFLAIEQQDGRDGESWTVYNIAGGVLWRGYAGVIAKIDGVDMVTATFDRPRWNAKGELTARAECTESGAKGSVTLHPSEAGVTAWRGSFNCPSGR
jgi:hypothetical protein